MSAKMKFLGADMSGLELRGLAHYLAPLDGGAYMRQVLEGDVHWVNAQAMGLATGDRDKHNALHTIIREDGSKRFIYAYIYGCGDDKAGEIIYNCLSKAKRDGGEAGQALYVKFFGEGVPGEKRLKAVGKKVRSGFLTSIDGFANLKAKLALQVDKHGWVPGLDGRRIPTRSEHSALNFMIQSCGAILCKRWMADSFDVLCGRFTLGTDFQFVLWVHDELQLLVREGIEDSVIAILKRCAEEAGAPYGFRGPLEAQAKVGLSWRDTH
jgi:DNA polymerase-1